MNYYSPETFEPCRSIGYLVKRVHRLSHALIEKRFADRDVNFSQWVSLMMVKTRLAETSSVLARQLGHNSGATTRLVDGLEARSLMERQPDPDDRRVSKLCLTPEGENAVTALTPIAADLWNELLADFEVEEVDQFVATLGKLMTVLESKTAAEEPA